ncbi:M12 family metallopeptidase [Flavobacterium sp. 2]|uniref:M12 family metallopeptidase n=1 Tax=Flavobacterium sp. 2 TaxID=308053 RepID=UPI003CF0D1D7
MCTFDLREGQNDLTLKSNAAIIDPRWEIGQIIKIKFLDGTNSQHEIVKKYASEWLKYANLKFEYVPKDQDAHIKIAINIGTPGTWSQLGSIGMYPSPLFANVQNTPTMRLGSISDNESSRRTILHEFGHALGLVHETTNPPATIKWDLSKVYKYYYDLMDWSKEKVDQSVINKANSTNYSEYDPLSIMHYYVPASLTTDGIAVN